MNSQFLKKKDIPDKPGVYIFLGDKKKSISSIGGREILYIGKATFLRDRVRSYFGKDLIGARGPVLVDMVFNAKDIKWIETDSVLEALILEANLIKKHQPRYNTKEKDDKSFNYVCISKEKIPKIVVVRGRELNLRQRDFKKTFGPFTNGNALREALRIIRRIFPFLDSRSSTKGNNEFYRQIGMAPDTTESNFLKHYKKNIKNIILFFEGKKLKIIKNLEKEMLSFAKRQEFEKANQIKKQIFSLNHIRDISLIKEDTFSYTDMEDSMRIEAYDVAHLAGKNMVGVMTVVVNGQKEPGEYKKFKIRSVMGANDTASLREILERRLAHHEWTLPDLIVVDGNENQKKTAEKVLKERGYNIDVVAVVKDARHHPKNIIGKQQIVFAHNNEILLANSEAHRFSISYYRTLSRSSIKNKLK